MAGKTGRARLEAAVKRLFSQVFDVEGAEMLSEDVTVKRADLEAVLLCFKVREEVGAVPQSFHPAQR
jgi:hypothetical protein